MWALSRGARRRARGGAEGEYAPALLLPPQQGRRRGGEGGVQGAGGQVAWGGHTAERWRRELGQVYVLERHGWA